MGRSLRAAVGVAAGVGVGLAATALGAPAARKDLFELSGELEARVAVHQDLVNNAVRSVDDFCRLAADSVKILDPVVVELSRFGGSEHQAVPFEAVERAYVRTERLIPGLRLVASEVGTQTGIDYRWLAKQAPADGRPLLRAMAAFELGPEGIVSWAVRITDDSSCDAPDRAHAALAAVVKTWSAAPACLRDALRDRLNQQLEDMTVAGCFCAGRDATLAAIRKNADLMKKLTDTRGPELGRRWLDAARAPDARFNCRPG
jgi:hypothetical protein